MLFLVLIQLCRELGVLVKFYVSWKYVERSQFMLSVAETIMFTVCCTT